MPAPVRVTTPGPVKPVFTQAVRCVASCRARWTEQGPGEATLKKDKSKPKSKPKSKSKSKSKSKPAAKEKNRLPKLGRNHFHANAISF